MANAESTYGSDDHISDGTQQQAIEVHDTDSDDSNKDPESESVDGEETEEDDDAELGKLSRNLFMSIA